jgi:HD-GYP domain-containing protein (c-di-GMP phosphodiesterase class II)
LYVYIAALAALASSGLLLCGLAMALAPSDVTHWLPYLAFFAAFGFLCNTQQLYFSDSNTVTMSTIGQVSAIVILPLPMAIVVAGVAKACRMVQLRWKHRRNWRSTVLNTSSSVLSTAVGGLAFHALHGDTYLWSGSFLMVVLGFPAVAALALGYHLIDVGTVTGAITLNSGEKTQRIFAQISRDTLMPEMSLIAVGMIFAILFHFSPALSFFVVVPVFLSMQSFGAVARLRKETVEAVLKMAESIDYRDTGTYEHSERLASYCQRVAAAISLTPEHVKEIVLASRVHDLGKIGISNDVLLKQGPLTLQERQLMEEHPVIGAKILSSYSSFKESVDIVRHHHERWDGKGYPDGLKGEEIPIGSRIITVVDSFDAMTSDRPYRKGMTVSDAVDRLKDGMGTQFDPRISATFIQLLIEDGSFVPVGEPMSLHIVEKEAG